MIEPANTGLTFHDLDDGGWAERESAITVRARAHTDYFIDPSRDASTAAESLANAVRLLAPAPDGDWQFSASVSVDFAATFDAGVLFLWVDKTHWAKLCFELSPAGERMVVSVVTRGVSDDANARVVEGASIHLRVSKIGRVFAYHASVDGRTWDFVRAFSLDCDLGDLKVGFEAQSPTGDGCDVAFSDVRFTRETLADLRSGI
jgi:hypothetical protein